MLQLTIHCWEVYIAHLTPLHNGLYRWCCKNQMICCIDQYCWKFGPPVPRFTNKLANIDGHITDTDVYPDSAIRPTICIVSNPVELMVLHHYAHINSSNLWIFWLWVLQEELDWNELLIKRHIGREVIWSNSEPSVSKDFLFPCMDFCTVEQEVLVLLSCSLCQTSFSAAMPLRQKVDASGMTYKTLSFGFLLMFDSMSFNCV